jgi:hypothetical protein
VETVGQMVVAAHQDDLFSFGVWVIVSIVLVALAASVESIKEFLGEF